MKKIRLIIIILFVSIFVFLLDSCSHSITPRGIEGERYYMHFYTEYSAVMLTGKQGAVCVYVTDDAGANWMIRDSVMGTRMADCAYGEGENIFGILIPTIDTIIPGRILSYIEDSVVSLFSYNVSSGEWRFLESPNGIWTHVYPLGDSICFIMEKGDNARYRIMTDKEFTTVNRQVFPIGVVDAEASEWWVKYGDTYEDKIYLRYDTTIYPITNSLSSVVTLSTSQVLVISALLKPFCIERIYIETQETDSKVSSILRVFPLNICVKDSLIACVVAHKRSGLCSVFLSSDLGETWQRERLPVFPYCYPELISICNNHVYLYNGDNLCLFEFK